MRAPARRPVLLALVTILALGVLGAAPAALGASPGPRTPRLSGIELERTTVLQLQRLMDRRRLSSVRLTAFYLRRIERLEPHLNAIITLNPRALREAREADRARRRGVEKPLLGIPVLLKDNIDTTGMPTTAGSWALDGSSPRDAFIVRRLKRAGAIILGKLNLSEWANFRSIPSSSGWSGIGGQTNMPYVLDRNACGSSSGSGVAAAAHLATLTVGTETDGSIVCPAGANSVVGIKPTVGLLSRSGIVPISADQDTAGPMTRSVTDAAVMLGAMTGVDEDDPATSDQRGHARRDYTRFLDDEALEGARIGVWREGTYDPTVTPEIEPIVDRVVRTLERQGAVIVDPARILIEDAYGPEFEALLCEFKDDIASYLAHTGPSYPKTLQDLIDFNAANPDLEGPWNSAIFDLAQATGGRADPACQAARAFATAHAQNAIDDLMEQHDLDAIIAPTNGRAWVTDPVAGDMGGDFSAFVGSSTPSAVAGYPSITVPAGFADQLPIGITFIAGRWAEPELIGFAYDYERASRARRLPRFLETIGPDPAVAASATAARTVDAGEDVLLVPAR